MTDFVDLGLIKSTKGLKGEVKVKPLIDAELFKSNKSYLITPPLQLNRKLTIEAVNTSKEPIVIKFKEINSIEEAQTLKGRYLQIPTDDLPDGYYSKDAVIGFKVFSKGGRLIGEVIAMEESIAHDIFVMKVDSKEARFASVKEIILDVDLKNKKIIIDTDKGLVDL